MSEEVKKMLKINFGMDWSFKKGLNPVFILTLQWSAQIQQKTTIKLLYSTKLSITAILVTVCVI